MDNIKKEISEIIQSKASDNDKLWQLMRLLQRFPEFINSALEKEISEAIESLETKIEEEIKKEINNIPKVEKIDYQFIISSVVSKIPKSKDGNTPTEKELKTIILPLIPKAEKGLDGEDAVIDYQYVLSEVLKRISKPKDGKDGSPDKPEQIAKKLNTLKEAVRLSVIQGLEKQLIDISKSAKERPVLRGGGASTFNKLNDVPSSYSGESGKIVKVKTSEDGLEFGAETSETDPVFNAWWDGATTLLSLKSMRNIWISVSAQAEGNLTLADATNWATQYSFISSIKVVTAATDWTAWLCETSAFDTALITSRQIALNRNGNYDITIAREYNSDSNNVYLIYTDNTAANTASILIVGEARRH